jgi:hypothetical protein
MVVDVGQALTNQDRVTAFDDNGAVPQRGLFTGNRGIIHDPATKKLLEALGYQRMLICVIEDKGAGARGEVWAVEAGLSYSFSTSDRAWLQVTARASVMSRFGAARRNSALTASAMPRPYIGGKASVPLHRPHCSPSGAR